MVEYDDTIKGWTKQMLVEQLKEILPIKTFLAEQGTERLEMMVTLAEGYIAKLRVTM